MIHPKVIVTGDQPKGRMLIKTALNQLAILEKQMSFKSLNEGYREMSPWAGTNITAWSSFGHQRVVTINVEEPKEQEEISIVKDQEEESINLLLAFYYLYTNEADDLLFDPLSYSRVKLSRIKGSSKGDIAFFPPPMNPITPDGIAIEVVYAYAYEVVTHPNGNHFDIPGNDISYTRELSTSDYTAATYHPPDNVTVCCHEPTEFHSWMGWDYNEIAFSDPIETTNSYTMEPAYKNMTGVIANVSGSGTIRGEVSWEHVSLEQFATDTEINTTYLALVPYVGHVSFTSEGTRSYHTIGHAVGHNSIYGSHDYTLSYGDITLGKYVATYYRDTISPLGTSYKIGWDGSTNAPRPNAHVCVDISPLIYFMQPDQIDTIYTNSSGVIDSMAGYVFSGDWSWTHPACRLLKGFDNNNKFIGAKTFSVSCNAQSYNVDIGEEFLFIGRTAGESPYFEFEVMCVGDTPSGEESTTSIEHRIFIEIDGVVRSFPINKTLTISCSNGTCSRSGTRVAGLTVSTNQIGYTYTYLLVNPGPDFAQTIISDFYRYSPATTPFIEPFYFDDQTYWPPHVVHNTDQILGRVVGFINTGINKFERFERFEVFIENTEEDLANASFVGDLIFYDKLYSVGPGDPAAAPVSAMVLKEEDNPALLHRALSWLGY